MKTYLYRLVFVCFIFILAGCGGHDATIQVNVTPSRSPVSSSSQLPILMPTTTPTVNVTPSPSATFTQMPTLTLTPLPTLEPDQAEQAILELMQRNGDCSMPCFWGIIPGISDFDQTMAFLNHLGGDVYNYGTDPVGYETSYSCKKEMHIHVMFQEENSRVKNIRAMAYGLSSLEIGSLDWAAFRPDNILRTYGMPSRVLFSLSYPTEPTTADTVGYDFVFFYDNQNLVIYYGEQRALDRPVIRVCPLVDTGMYGFDFWLGEGFENILDWGVEVQDASSLSVADFYNLMLGDPEDACFDLNADAFHVFGP